MRTQAVEAREPDAIDRLLDEAPAGFEVQREADGTLTIAHRRTGMGCLNVFVVLMLVGCTAACIGVPLFLAQMGLLQRELRLLVPAFCVMPVVALSCAAFVHFNRRVYRLDRSSLTMTSQTVFWRRTRSLSKPNLRRVEQTQDGGKGRDSFPSWGLVVYAKRRVNLVFRQPYETSRWLGQVVALWSGVPFDGAEPPKSKRRT